MGTPEEIVETLKNRRQTRRVFGTLINLSNYYIIIIYIKKKMKSKSRVNRNKRRYIKEN